MLILILENVTKTSGLFWGERDTEDYRFPRRNRAFPGGRHFKKVEMGFPTFLHRFSKVHSPVPFKNGSTTNKASIKLDRRDGRMDRRASISDDFRCTIAFRIDKKAPSSLPMPHAWSGPMPHGKQMGRAIRELYLTPKGFQTRYFVWFVRISSVGVTISQWEFFRYGWKWCLRYDHNWGTNQFRNTYHTATHVRYKLASVEEWSFHSIEGRHHSQHPCVAVAYPRMVRGSMIFETD